MLEHVCVCLCVRVLTHHNLDAVCMRKCAGVCGCVCVSKSRAHVSSSCFNILMCEATTAAVVVLLRTHLLHTHTRTYIHGHVHTPPAYTHINHTF